MSRRIAIIQSCYIPWRGYFAIIAQCDAFIILDSVQFSKNSWRNRNRIKTPTGSIWLSIPVRLKGQSHVPIDAIEVADPDWATKHLRTIAMHYRHAPFFTDVFPVLEAAYAAVAGERALSAINWHLTRALCGLLNIATPILRDVDLIERDRLQALNPTARLVELVAAVNGNEYLSGPAAQSYLDEAAFKEHGIAVGWMDYSGLSGYRQQWGEFDPALSIVDALLNLGPEGARATLA